MLPQIMPLPETQKNALYKLGRYEEAIFCYNQAIEIEPLLVRAWHNKKLALEIQMKKSTRKISISNAKSQDTRNRTQFTR
jgi:tetratricopeptide (TPR) repeat protein